MSDRTDAERLAVLVHEVRSPVAALHAIATTLAEPPVEGRSRRELVRLVIAACRAIERTVLDASLTSIRREEVDPGGLVREAASAAAVAGARVEARVAPGLPPISGDGVRLRQALDNLVSNAVVHGGPDTVIVVEASASRHEVRLSVADHGVGIPVGERERILEAGVRLDPTRPGSGLGLAIVRAIAEAHGGHLVVESAPGEGATFTIALPRAD
jgi:signal transduction histidine kinase